MPKKHTSWKDYLNDLDNLYQMALGKENISAALKIKELQIKTHQEEQEHLHHFDALSFTSEKLDHLIGLIEENAKVVRS